MPTLLAEIEAIEQPIDLADDDDSPPDIFDGDDDDRDDDRARWLTVATFSEPTEAHIGRLKLESEEIDCIILDENLVATYWFWANAVGGIKLQVRESDFTEAARLLNVNHQPIENQNLHCPECGSQKIDPLPRRFAFLSMLPFIPHREKCAACGFEWTR